METDRIEGTAKSMAGKAKDAAGRVTGDLGTQASGKIDEAVGTVQNAYGRAKETVRSATDQGSAMLDEAVDQTGKYYKQGNRAVARQVEEMPIASLVLAGAVGYLLALAVHGRQ